MKKKSFYIALAVVCVAVIAVIAAAGMNASPPTAEPVSEPKGTSVSAAAD